MRCYGRQGRRGPARPTPTRRKEDTTRLNRRPTFLWTPIAKSAVAKQAPVSPEADERAGRGDFTAEAQARSQLIIRPAPADTQLRGVFGPDLVCRRSRAGRERILSAAGTMNRGVLQLKEPVVRYCPHGGSSRGARDFVFNHFAGCGPRRPESNLGRARSKTFGGAQVRGGEPGGRVPIRARPREAPDPPGRVRRRDRQDRRWEEPLRTSAPASPFPANACLCRETRPPRAQARSSSSPRASGTRPDGRCSDSTNRSSHQSRPSRGSIPRRSSSASGFGRRRSRAPDSPRWTGRSL